MGGEINEKSDGERRRKIRNKQNKEKGPNSHLDRAQSPSSLLPGGTPPPQ